MSDMHSTLAAYWKAERDRLEECLADIVQIMDGGDAEAQLDAIIDRIISHYKREPR